ncbi:MAG: TldD/PmbA family protein [Chloroflexi bacterium]|nr:TldD/PmbA family protein [Chloroflexota bacterium]
MAYAITEAGRSQIAAELVDQKLQLARDVVAESRSMKDLQYCDLRLEVVESKEAWVENGQPKVGMQGERLCVGIRVIAGNPVAAPAYYGVRLGTAAGLAGALRDGIRQAHERALASAQEKALARRSFGPLGASLYSTRLAPVPLVQERVPPSMRRDPRSVPLAEVFAYLTPISARLAALDGRVLFNLLRAETQLRRQLFCSSEGACIDQTYARTEGICVVVAQSPDGASPLELYDASGHQAGWELMEEGLRRDYVQLPDFETFCLALAQDALGVSAAPPLKPPDGDVVVVTDPHFNALVAHEVVGHPTELDRALKMETAYAGRSWLLKDLQDNQVGKVVASPLLSAFSDPTLDGYGHYLYDDEGTPGRRAYHFESGVFKEFLNSRQTAAVAGVAPNGSYKATEADLVPLIRMSNTAFAAGDSDPAQIVAEVDHGYYVQTHRIPSVAESRENFCISAVKVYEINNGQLGRPYRDGAVAADSRDYFLRVDAVGNDLRLFPIPNCGKGQPMQAKRMSNGGPTLRSVARLVGTRQG